MDSGGVDPGAVVSSAVVSSAVDSGKEGSAAVLRMGAMVVAMELMAVLVAYGYFGWPILLIGAPAVVGTVMVLLVVRASEAPRRMLQEHRASRWDPDAALPGGLMSGFFEVSRKRPQP